MQLNANNLETAVLRPGTRIPNKTIFPGTNTKDQGEITVQDDYQVSIGPVPVEPYRPVNNNTEQDKRTV